MELIVIYDISTVDDKGRQRLLRVAKVCEQYGVRVQKSVFECRITESSHERLIADLTQIIDPTQDSITIHEVPGSLRAIRNEYGKTVISINGPWIV
jgi:CRISPR-associated protein Cas2